MATSDGAENAITLRDSCSTINYTLAESTPRFQKFRHVGRVLRRKWQFRSIGSRSILLILIWQFLITCSLGITWGELQVYTLALKKDEIFPLGLPAIGILVLCCSIFPISSLLAEVAIGRYKLISYSLKLMWLLYIVSAVISVWEESPVGLYSIQLFLTLTQFLLLGAFLASAVPLGIDQIVSGTNTNISAFIQWLSWAFYSGFAIPDIVELVLYNCTDFLKKSQVNMIMSLLPVILLSVGLILDFCFHHKLVKEPVTVNPVSHIFKVLKYAAKHKYPVQRSAFTYCENEQPTRLDYGKSKYGGPFTTEQVEDVKTFWRVLVVLLVISLSGVPLIAQGESEPASLISLQPETDCIHTLSQTTFKTFPTLMILIPLYELLIYPCLRNRGPSILKSAGIGAAALIASSVYGIIAETAIFNNTTTECMLRKNASVAVYIPLNLIVDFTTTVLPKSSVVFVCAQAPYNVRGFLIGLFFTLITFFIIIGTLIFFTWNSKWLAILDTSTCGIWFYLTTLVLAVMSSALLGLVIRWYKARERDEITPSQGLVEEVYHRYQEQASQD